MWVAEAEQQANTMNNNAGEYDFSEEKMQMRMNKKPEQKNTEKCSNVRARSL